MEYQRRSYKGKKENNNLPFWLLGAILVVMVLAALAGR